MKIIVAVLATLLVTSPAFAQQPQANAEFLMQALDAVSNQRNRALNEDAIAEAKLTQAQKQIEELKKENADLKAKSAPKPNDDTDK